MDSTNDARRTVRVQDLFTVKYVNELVNTVQDVWNEQFNAMSSSWDDLQKGHYETSRWLPDAARLWGNWARGMERIGASFMAPNAASGGLPAAVFLVDTLADTTDAKEVTIPARQLKAGPIQSTALVHSGGAHSILGTQVKVRRLGSGESLEVKLVGIEPRSLQPGQYTGAIYVKHEGGKIPIALVYVIVEGPDASKAPSAEGSLRPPVGTKAKSR